MYVQRLSSRISRYSLTSGTSGPRPPEAGKLLSFMTAMVRASMISTSSIVK